MTIVTKTILRFAIFVALPTAATAADNRLTAQEIRDGWILLFNGKTLDGWMNSNEQPSLRPVENGCINPHRCGAYMMVPKQVFENFILSTDFKIAPHCNSGIFVRTWPLKPAPGRDTGWNGIEVQIMDSPDAGFYDTGAFYDLVPPRKNAMRPVGRWNHMVIRCDRNIIEVNLNGEDINRIDLDQFSEPYSRPDGTSHKFDYALKDRPRMGYIGLQDHGTDCWYKNIKLKPLP